MRVLKDQRPAGVVHCFSGSAETAKEVIRLGMYIGFTGVLTFKNAKRQFVLCKKYRKIGWYWRRTALYGTSSVSWKPL